MKVLLVELAPDPQSITLDDMAGMFEPIALEYIGAGVQSDHDVKLLDLRVRTEPGLKETLESFQPDIIGCGCCTMEINPAKKVFAEAKKMFPQILTVVGGHHATVRPEDLFGELIDVVVSGEGIIPFKKICRCHQRKESFQDIENIYYRKDGQMVFTYKKEYPPLDDLPFPLRSLTTHTRGNYFNYVSFKPINVALLRGSLGCIFRCKFCAITSVLNRKLYKRSIEQILEELAAIEEPRVMWIDDEFFLDAKRAVLLAKEIQNAGIKKSYHFLARADTIIKHTTCVEEWAKLGPLCVMVGMESHKEGDLKKMRKGTTISKNEEVIRILHANNISVQGNFMIQPNYTADDFNTLVDYIKKLDLGVPSLSVYTPLPGTDYYEEDQDRLITDNYNLFDLYHTLLPPKIPLPGFYKHFAQSYGKIMTTGERVKEFSQIPSSERMKFIRKSSEFVARVEQAYKDYEEEVII